MAFDLNNLYWMQIDYLQNKNRDYERKLREANLELETVLSDKERVAKKLQADKQIVVQAADREMSEAKVISVTTLDYVK